MRIRPKTWAELEKQAGIERTVAPAPTQRDIELAEKKRLGRRWRKKRLP